MQEPVTIQPDQTGYAPVNGLEMYYEVYGTGQPLVLLHGGMTTIQDFAFMLPGLLKGRQVIAYERQGHGHTADIDRPFTMEGWADDLAALLQHLGIPQADVLGYSTGGSVALAFALRHPQQVRKLVLISTIYDKDGYPTEVMAGLLHANADSMPDILREMYAAVAPRPEDWSELVRKSVAAAGAFEGWTHDALQAISMPTLVAVGDIDIVRLEHAVELYRILPQSQLAILPATDHVAIILQHADWLTRMVTAFLDSDSA
jgi:pimeloyl-ACP methyl ester carboxylesterase